MTLDTERVGERERDKSVGLMSGRHGDPDGFLGRLRVPQIALDLRDLGASQELSIYVLSHECRGNAKVRRHGSLAIGCHEHQRTSGRNLTVKDRTRSICFRGPRSRGGPKLSRPAALYTCAELDAENGHVVDEYLTQLVGRDLAYVACPAS